MISLSFLAGAVIAAPIIFVRYNQLAHSIIGAPWSADAAPSEGYGATSLILAIAGCVIAGSIVGLIASFASRIDQSRRFASIGVLIPIGVFGAIVFAIGLSVFDSWTRFEANYQQSFRDSLAAEKKRLAPGPRDLPIREGPFLYPNRSEIKGDSFTVKMRTPDDLEKVVAYYDSLGAHMHLGNPAWEGVFTADGKRLRVYALDGIPRGTDITLQVDGY